MLRHTAGKLSALKSAWAVYKAAECVRLGAVQGSAVLPAQQLSLLREYAASSYVARGSAYATKAGKRKHGKGDAAEFEVAETDVSIQDVKLWMQQPVDRLRTNLAAIRAGRASPGMLDLIKVAAYGEKTPNTALKSLATVSTRDGQTLAVSVYDSSTLQAVEKAIRDSPLSLSPQVKDGEIVVHVPRPSKEHLDAMAKLLRSEGEAAKVGVRQARKRALDALKSLVSDDARKKTEKQVQSETDAHIRAVDAACADKTSELSAVA